MTEETASEATKREVSSIAFPYLDMSDAVAVASAMHRAGGVPMDRDQLAAALGHVPVSGAFATKISTARMFGLIESVAGRFQLTELGFEIVDPTREKAAKINAFLNVPLYKKTFEEFRGRQLPPRPFGLEQAFIRFGVSSKQADKARQAFDRSARSAGFFPTQSEDRLVQPVVATETAGAQSSAATTSVESVQVPIAQVIPSPAKQTYHPFVQGLLETLPEVGNEWATDDRVMWLQAAANIFNLLYKGGSGDISVSVKKAM